ncbi:MAG: type IV conjugative transfer system lipoprotein TraV [Methylococcales bacterium]|jgi:conjugal transfer pilus assembly protein TraV|nr:type IV conjugative transfer system lipoprotein TraV [Methylococcales bacterium]
MNILMKGLLIGGLASLQGCSSMMSVGQEDFACKGYANTPCQNTEDVYNQTNGNVLTTAIVKKKLDITAQKTPVKTHTNNLYSKPQAVPTFSKPVPIRSAAKNMRIWIAPWEDKSGDFHIPSYIYTEIEKRRWSIGEQYSNENNKMILLN